VDLAQYRDRWRDGVNAIMNLCFPKNAGNCLTNVNVCAENGRKFMWP
jgi:hypothetical protein